LGLVQRRPDHRLGQSLLVDTLFDLNFTAEMLAGIARSPIGPTGHPGQHHSDPTTSSATNWSRPRVEIIASAAAADS